MRDAPSVLACITGPTASGKSAAALQVALDAASRRPIEIISMDSALVYRGMDIGTAKPTVAQRQAVPHHLIDIRDPAQRYDAAAFIADVQRLHEEIRQRGALPLLVGGTLMYLNALRRGLAALPGAHEPTRQAIDAEAISQGWPAMHAELSRVDAVTAARLAPHDAQRIQRALEVFRLTGVPLSEWHRREADAPGPAAWPGLQLHILSLEPQDRAWLHERIAQRLREMWQAGFEDEVLELRSRGDLHLGLPSMRCVGYRQVWEALDAAGATHRLDEAGSQLALQRATAATRQLAKRQLTWLRSMPERTVVACDANPQLPAQVYAWAQQALEA